MFITMRKHYYVSALLILVLCQITPPLSAIVNSPKIISKDGHLIFESGLDRNISFVLKGKSRLNINDEFDVIDLLLQSKKGRISAGGGTTSLSEWSEEEEAVMNQLMADVNSVKTQVFGPNGMDARLRTLQNRTRNASQTLRRYKNRVHRAETRVQALYDRLETDSCRNSPCQNGATCLNMFGSFVCKCSKNFEGTTCDKDVNECALYAGTDLGCQNDAQCINQFGSFSCICKPGWFGIHCTQRKGDCLASSAWELCGHGVCVSSNDTFGYKCICDQGWKTTGMTPACTVDVDECAESHTSCATKCINLPGSFTCAPCAAGLTGNGINCRDIDECAQQNGGCSRSPKVSCINSYGSYHCGECPLGWSGDGRYCERSSTTSTDSSSSSSSSSAVSSVTNCATSNICHPQAKCQEISNTVSCSCPTGMVGSGIGPKGCVMGTEKNCISQPCMNGGTCVDNGNDFNCICPVGYTGKTCQPVFGSCTPNPCRNNGRCNTTPGLLRIVLCQCAPGFTGQRCEKPVNECGGVLNGLTGRLAYPPGSLYDHNSQCAWILRTNESLVLNVTFHRFELEDATECRFDWLQINDGRSAASQIIGRFCGSHKPLGGNIISSTNNLYLWFRSDNSTAKEGFELEWNSIAPQCGGIVNVATHGTISSPGSPGNYPMNRDCRWTLKAPNDKRLKLTFFSMKIEMHDSCNYDYLEIIDAISGESLEKFCNSTNPQRLLLPTNEAYIDFHSDNIGSDLGFQIFYSVEERTPGCGGTYTTSEGTITSPHISEESISCEYDINLSDVDSLSINILNLKLGSDDCIELYDISKDNEKLLQAKYCADFGVTPIHIRSIYNRMQIKFHGKPGAEFKLKYIADCSKSFETPEGVIMTPGYPKLTNSFRYCTYKIITEPNTVISIHFDDFDMKDSSLEGDKDCAYTSFRINDDMNKNILGPYCGETSPDVDFVSKTNALLMHLKTSQTTAGRGFKLTYKSVPLGKTDCGGVYTKPGYDIRLPTNDEGVYMDNMECYWVIMAPKNMYILLNWKSFKLEESTDCSYDYVEIYDNVGNTENNSPLGRFCDAHKPESFLSHARMLTVKFVSDSSDSTDGFEFNYEFIDGKNQCNGNIHSSTGRINTPNWPENYTEDLDCIWIVNTPPGTQVELQVESFDLEYASNCSSDWLEIRNGGTNQSTVIGRFCGNYSSIPHSIPAFTNQMYLHFHSNSFVGQHGFQIRWFVYSNGCGGNLQSNRGAITSPFYPNSYSNNAECEWRIHVHPGSVIHLTIDDIALENHGSCQYDKLEIYEGTSELKSSVATLCYMRDSEMGKEYIIDGNEALILFETDDTNRDRGFAISYRANCTVTLTKNYGVIESPNFGLPASDFSEDVNCTWTLKAPKGNHIQLEFTHYESWDKKTKLDVRDVGNKTVDIQGMGQIINSTGDTMIITQTSNLLNFQLEYAMVGCVERMRDSEGEFQSPNYPNTYPNDMECLWEIVTQPGQGIVLTVDPFDLEDSVNCTKDALVISSHVHSNNPKERHCGKQRELVITSSSHKLYVRFYSDGQNNAKGFKASYKTQTAKCGGVLSSQNGIITSPNYPNPYPEESDCEWTISVADHHAIVFTLEELDMEDFYECEMDYVEAVEETDSDETKELFKQCGDMDGKEVTSWRSTKSKVTVRFHSDDSISSRGFKLSYMEDCGQRFELDDSGMFDIDIAKYAQTNQTCEWQIVSKDLSKHVFLTFSHIQMNPALAYTYRTEGDCIDKGAVVYDGLTDTSPVRARFCKSHPADIMSNGHALTLKVPMNIISEIVAWAYTMDNYCGGYYKSLRGKFSTPLYPSSYPVSIQCQWYITASSGNRIQVTFESMDLEDSDECNNDYVEVRDDDLSGKLLGVYCGNRVPPTITAVRESVVVVFQSNDDIVGEGFTATYSYVLHNELNGTKGTVESPAYPSKFHSHDTYSWRITVNKEYVVLLSIKHIIDTDMPYIKFYDGYSDIGAPIDYTNSHVVQSNTNILYFTASRGPFEFEWEQLSKEVVRSNRTAERMSELCGGQTLRINNSLLFNSPGYPNGYANNLQCAWNIMSNDPAMHAVVTFFKIDMEEFEDCFADNVKISSSKDLQNWQLLETVCKKEANKPMRYEGTPYLKIEFNTDGGVNKTGFGSLINTKCGSELTDRRGFVNISATRNVVMFSNDCVWTIRVRQGRRIRLKFPDSYLHGPNGGGDCKTFFLVRNGIDEDSPFLGKGKYCENDITDVLESSSNRVYIKFSRIGFPGFRASFHYEEITHDCSDEITLTDHSKFDVVQTLNSPNYPNIPNPHSECIWKIRAPLHKTITLDFFGDFDLIASESKDSKCEQEYIQINDGATEMAPRLGRYCGKTKPNSLRSTGSVMRLLYYTDVAEPHKGFQANVSISRCGGFFYEAEGILKSPDDLKLKPKEKELECVYTIETELGSTINITIEQMNMFDAELQEECKDGTHLELQEIDAFTDGFDNITDTLLLCNAGGSRYIVETNKLVLRYKIRDGQHNADAFKISYSSMGSRCGETITASQGILMTPNYPIGNTMPTQCTWHLKAPKGLRIKAEFLDFDVGSEQAMGRVYRRILISNDFKMTSVITRITNTPPAVVYSTDNTMSIDALLLSFVKNRGFKIKYTAFEPSIYCDGRLWFNSEAQPKTLKFKRDNGTAVYCAYELKPSLNQTIAVQVIKEQKYPKADWLPYGCQYFTPLQLYVGDDRLMGDLLCKNETQPSFRLPFATQLVLNGNQRNSLQELELQYSLYECGGIWGMEYYSEFIITEPNMTQHRGHLECAWAVLGNLYDLDTTISFDDLSADLQMEVSLSTDLKGKCEDEYLIVYNGPNQNSPHLGRYCSQSSLKNIVVTGGVFVEFITQNYSKQSTFNLTVREGSGCGGTLSYPYREIMFDYQYKNNVECIWELETEPGFHLAAIFKNRFFIESSTDCSKDYLKIQQKSGEDTWEDLATLCGRTPPPVVNTTSTAMRLIFRSDNDVVADGFTVKFERNCGGILYATDTMQQIASPGYPNQYPANLFCNYTILPTPIINKTETDNLYIRFIAFEVEDAPTVRCMFDNVTLFTKSNMGESKETVLCGRKANYEVRSKQMISVVLRTDESYPSKGFLMEYGHNKCGAVVTNSSIIVSPQESTDKMYPHSSKCSWQLQAPPKHKILIKFEQFDFEGMGMCTYDGVEVYKGLSIVEDQRLGKFCGNLTGKIPLITISQNTALIHSFSDERDASRGFRALVRFIPNCDQSIYLQANNATYEFNHFSGQYANNLDCSWSFTTTPDRQLQIEFTTFHVENSTSCSNDYLEVFDGPGSFSDIMGKFCGHEVPSTMTSSRHVAMLHFVTDANENSGGFSARIRSVPTLCGHRSIDLTTQKTAMIASPDDGSGKYPNNINCIWKLKSDNNIHLKFEKLDIETGLANGSCSADYVKFINSDDTDIIDQGFGTQFIYNGLSNGISAYRPNFEFGAEHIYCGNRIPDDYFSSSKAVFVKFKSNENVPKTGFRLKASSVDGCFRNFTGVQGRIKISESTDNCNIYIKAPINTTLSLYYADLMFSEYDCSKEFMEVFDARTNTSLQRLCEFIDTGKSLFSNTNELRIYLKLSGYYTQLDLTYLASTESPGCGGDLYNTEGIIASPFYPGNMRSNSDCRWNIRVPSNMKVQLRFPVFNLGAKSTCHTDYVQLIEYDNGDDVGSPQKVLRQFCGEDEPKFYRSEGSFVTVRFHKTLNYDGTGWVIQFRAVHTDSEEPVFF